LYTLKIIKNLLQKKVLVRGIVFCSFKPKLDLMVNNVIIKKAYLLSLRETYKLSKVTLLSSFITINDDFILFTCFCLFFFIIYFIFSDDFIDMPYINKVTDLHHSFTAILHLQTHNIILIKRNLNKLKKEKARYNLFLYQMVNIIKIGIGLRILVKGKLYMKKSLFISKRRLEVNNLLLSVFKPKVKINFQTIPSSTCLSSQSASFTLIYMNYINNHFKNTIITENMFDQVEPHLEVIHETYIPYEPNLFESWFTH